MNYYTTSFESGTLKLLLTKEITGQKIKVNWVNSLKSVSTLLSDTQTTALKLNNGSFLFSSNAICKYLYSLKQENSNYDIKVDQWLEWENINLSPLVNSLHHGPLNSVQKKNLIEKLEFLNSEILKNGGYLRGNECLPDVVIWANVYFLYSHKLVLNECLEGFDIIHDWFERLQSNSHFSKALDAFNKKDNFKELPSKPLDSSTTNSFDSWAALMKEVNQVEIDVGQIEKSYINWIKPKSKLSRSSPSHPKLPIEGKRNVLITSALPYVNNVPHLGNIIGSVLSADVFAKYCKLRGANVLYICGTDEYGTATETKALEEGLTPQEICNKYNKIHADIYKWFNIEFDHFGRTSTDYQTKIAQEIFWNLHKNEYLLEEFVEQLFCDSCQRFLADRFVQGICPFCNYEDARGDQCDKCGKLINAPDLKNPRCKVCNTHPILKTSKHLFLDLPKLEPKLRKWLDKSTASGKWTHLAKAISYSWIKDGLKPRCITRDLKWGTPVPLEGFKDKVFYVWFDAPIGYLSISAQYTNQWEKWWKQPDKVQLYQFMAKDNVPFHSVIFPSCLLGTHQNYTIVNHLSGISYLNYEDAKFSKSRGVGVFGTDCKETNISSDIWRFYLLFIRPESHDASFCWLDLMNKNNSDLLGNLGNFINRALTFISKNFKGTIPEMALNDSDKLLIARINVQLTEYIEQIENLILRDAIRNILNISRFGNLYIQINEPWVLIKGTPEEKLRAGTVMGLSTNIACLISLLLEPYLPESVAKLRKQLNYPMDATLPDVFECLLPPGHKIGKPSPLFRKIEPSEIEELKERFKGKTENGPRK